MKRRNVECWPRLLTRLVLRAACFAWAAALFWLGNVSSTPYSYSYFLRLVIMPTDLINGFGKVYLSIAYDAANHWVHNEWIGYQTYVGIVAGADACLPPLRENKCAYLLNDNRQVIGPWDHAVEWIITNWAPRAIAQGLTHFANVVSPESLAAGSAQAMALGLNGQLQMHMFGTIEEAQSWLRVAQSQAKAKSNA